MLSIYYFLPGQVEVRECIGMEKDSRNERATREVKQSCDTDWNVSYDIMGSEETARYICLYPWGQRRLHGTSVYT